MPLAEGAASMLDVASGRHRALRPWQDRRVVLLSVIALPAGAALTAGMVAFSGPGACVNSAKETESSLSSVMGPDSGGWIPAPKPTRRDRSAGSPAASARPQVGPSAQASPDRPRPGRSPSREPVSEGRSRRNAPVECPTGLLGETLPCAENRT